MPTNIFVPISDVIAVASKRGRKLGSKNKPKAQVFTPSISLMQEKVAVIAPLTFLRLMPTDTAPISTLDGYIEGLVNYIYVVFINEDGTVEGHMVCDDPSLLYYYKNVSQVSIKRTFLSKGSMFADIGKMGVSFLHGKKYNKVVILDDSLLDKEGNVLVRNQEIITIPAITLP